MSRVVRLAGLSLVLMLTAGTHLCAHGTAYEVLTGGVVGIRASFDDGAPMADAPVLVFAPGDTAPALETRTDPRGVVCFAPDRSGTWVLQVREASGHGLRVNLEISEDLSIAQGSGEPPGSMSGFQIALMALCVCWGFAGTALFFRARRRV